MTPPQPVPGPTTATPIPPEADAVSSDAAAADQATDLENPEGSPEEESTAESVASSRFVSQFYPRGAIEGGFTFTDLDNGRGLFSDHSGGYGRIEGGFEYSISEDVFIQANAAGSYGSLSMGLGEGVSSSHDYVQLLLNGRGGWNGLGGNLRLHGGLDLGVVHVGAPECSDGLGCGAVFTQNPQLLPIDSWAMNLGLEAGISTLQGGLALYGRLGWMFGVNPEFNVVDASADTPNFGLNIPYFQVGLQAEVFSLIRAITGSGSSTGAAEEEESESAAEGEGTDGAGSTEETPDAGAGDVSGTPTGMALVRQRQEDINGYVSQISQAASAASAARTAYTAIEGSTAESNRDRRVQVLEFVNQARSAAEAVTHISELIAEARGGLEAISDATERGDARRLITAMAAQLTEARAAASGLYRDAQRLVREFNRLTPGEDVTLDFADPQPPARRRRRADTEEGGSESRPGGSRGTGGTRFRIPPADEDGAAGESPTPRVPGTGSTGGGSADPSVDVEAGE